MVPTPTHSQKCANVWGTRITWATPPGLVYRLSSGLAFPVSSVSIPGFPDNRTAGDRLSY
jgi:hypothetical protein